MSQRVNWILDLALTDKVVHKTSIEKQSAYMETTEHDRARNISHLNYEVQSATINIVDNTMISKQMLDKCLKKNTIDHLSKPMSEMNFDKNYSGISLKNYADGSDKIYEYLVERDQIIGEDVVRNATISEKISVNSLKDNKTDELSEPVLNKDNEKNECVKPLELNIGSLNENDIVDNDQLFDVEENTMIYKQILDECIKENDAINIVELLSDSHLNKNYSGKSFEVGSQDSNKTCIIEKNQSFNENIIANTDECLKDTMFELGSDTHISKRDSGESFEVNSNASDKTYIPETDTGSDQSFDRQNQYIHDVRDSESNSENNLLDNKNISNKKNTSTKAKSVDFYKTKTVLPKKRIWNKRDYCRFCETEVLKFSRHVLRHHSDEIEITEILALRKGDRKRKFLFNKLRNEGNFLKATYNESITPVRKPVFGIENVNQSNYLPCKYCKGFYKKKFLFKHVKNCPHNNDKSEKTHAQADGQSLFSTHKHDSILRKEVFPSMRGDAISLAAKTDSLICAVAERYLKSHKGKQFFHVAARKMRQLGSLLIEIKKKSKCKNLLCALDPTYFDNLVRCTKIISKYDERTETYGAPSLAANMGTLLKECIDVAHSFLIKSKNTKAEDLKNLLILKDLIISEWRYEISTIANNDLQQKKWNKPSLIPLGEDLALLKSYLLKESKKYFDTLSENETDQKAFVYLQELTYVALIFLNRRRVGELQRMTLHSYETNIAKNISPEFDSCITESEKILMRSFKRIIIKGKRNRGVPVLFTDHMVKCTNLLVKTRQNFVPSKNLYLFANIKSLNSISGSQVIYKHVRLAGAKNPASLTSTKLRKHLATMSQVLNLSSQDLEQLAGFMGHTADIHKTYYRLPNDIYQTAKVSKLLILCEKGQAAKYKNKSLDDIEINLSAEEADSSGDEAPNIGETDITNIHEAHASITKENNQESASPIKKKKRILEPWTEEQKNLTLEHFKNHVKNKTPPKKMECEELKNKFPIIFETKTWTKIKIFVVNTYNKIK